MPGTLLPVAGGRGGDSDAVQEAVNAEATSSFDVPLDAGQQVPAPDLPAASAQAELEIDRASGAVRGEIGTGGLTGSVSAAHVHRGFAGRNGPVVLTLEPREDGATVTVPDGAGFDADALMALAEGELYVDVHTAAHPDGEVCGQIVPIGVLLEGIELSAAAVVQDPATGAPAVVSEASGTGFSTLNEATGALSVTLVLEGIDDATGVDLGVARAGAEGPVILSLERVAGRLDEWRLPEGTTLDAVRIEAFRDEALYVRVTSPRYPAGEIRGQL